jgi:mono/diheme cytochrome c family protein
MTRTLPAVIGIAVLALTFGACSKGSSSSTETTTTTTTSNEAASPAAMGTSAAASPATVAGGNGAQIFSTNCASCHQANGQGNAAFPPLAKNPVVTGPATKVIHIVKYGLNGAVTVNGKTFNGQMPAWKGTLSDGDIASVITYIRSSWGNNAPAVTAAQVSAVKQ